MSRLRSKAMDATEIDQFLEAQWTGVLCLGTDEAGYGIPVSYQYKPDDQDLYFRLAFAPDSQKRQFVESSSEVTFVVYDETEEGWKSVIAEGPLEQLSESDVETSILQSIQSLEIPFVDVFDRDFSDLDFRIMRLQATKIGGRVEA